MATQHILSPGQTLTVSAGAGVATVQQVGNPTGGAHLLPAHSASFGPYLTQQLFLVDGDASVATEEGAVAAIGSFLLVSEGAPEDAVQASLAVNPTGDDNGLVITAQRPGADGNAISIGYVDPGAADQALAVSVAGTSITVSLATDGAGVITTTAAEIAAAIAAHPRAAALVSAAVDADDSGSDDDGSGVVTAMAFANLEGGAGTGVGLASPGALCIDTASGKLYRNVGSKAAPQWVSPDDLHLYGVGAPVDYTDGDPPATGEGTAYPGALYTDIDNGTVYRNSGTRAEPSWTAIGGAE